MSRSSPHKELKRLRRDVKAKLARGEALQEDGQLAAARKLFDEVLALDLPDDLRGYAYSARADVRDDEDDFEGAIADYSEAIRMAPGGDPAGAEYYLGRSRAWRALGDRERALKDAIEARRLGAEVDPGYIKEVGG